MSGNHPTFANPAVAEALCELHFSPLESAPWNSRWFGDFYKKIQQDFPSMEPQQIMEVAALLSPDVTQTQLRTPTLRMRFRHRDRPHLVQLSPGVLTVNELKPYPGWASFSEDIRSAWETLLSVLPPVAVVNRIGLRYVNRVPRSDPSEKLSEWLAPSDYYPKQVLSLSSAFMNRFELALDDGLRLIVTVGEAADVSDAKEQDEKAAAGTPLIILDLDAVLEGSIKPTWEELKPELDAVHEHLWKVFSSTLTERFEGHLHKHAD